MTIVPALTTLKVSIRFIAIVMNGTRLSTKGSKLLSELVLSMPAEMSISTCSVSLGKFNYGILLRQMSYVIKTGIEQRDSAIKMNALGATTLVYKDRRFIIPNTNFDALRTEQNLHALLVKGLNPDEDDVLIIGSDNKSERTAEFAAKSAAKLVFCDGCKRYELEITKWCQDGLEYR